MIWQPAGRMEHPQAGCFEDESMDKRIFYRVDMTERALYAEIAGHDGIKAKDLGRTSGIDRKTVNQYLFNAPFLRELCYRDDAFFWHGLIRQTRPHRGLGDFCGWYGTAAEFLAQDEETWLAELMQGCRNIGRNLNDTRGLIHSFCDCRLVMRRLLEDLGDAYRPDWELAFELRINRARHIRIYADVLLITEDKVFSLEFKMKDKIDPEELAQAAKYTEYLEVLFGPEMDVIPALVLTAVSELYCYEPLGQSDALLPVCSGDMLFNLLDEYLGFLDQ